MSSTALRFPDGFVWGAATSSHQAEGGNVNNDSWASARWLGTVARENGLVGSG